MRTIAAGLAALAIAASAAAAVPNIRLPRDHYAHRTAGIEWWYVTSDVRGSDGHRYAVFVTLFKQGPLVLPVSQVVNLDTGERVAHTEIVVPALVGSTTIDVDTPLAKLRYRPGTDTWTFGASGLGYQLALTATPEKRYVVHGGGTGIVRLGSLESGYYSSSRTRVRGTMVSGLRTIAFSGTGWFDHQWVEPRLKLSLPKWDWFACQFDDGTELMVYGFRDRAGRLIAADRVGTLVRRNGSSRLVTDHRLVAGSRALRARGRRWPLDWRIEVPSERLEVSLRAVVPDQLVRGALLPTFWEGVADATGTKHGRCFVEETG